MKNKILTGLLILIFSNKLLPLNLQKLQPCQTSKEDPFFRDKDF